MARGGQSNLGGLIVLGVAGYLAYQYWPQLSAWFSGLESGGAAGGVAPGAPASAGMVVSLPPSAGPTVLVPGSSGQLVPTAPVQSVPQPQPIGPGSSSIPLETPAPMPAPIVVYRGWTPRTMPIRGRLVTPAMDTGAGIAARHGYGTAIA